MENLTSPEAKNQIKNFMELATTIDSFNIEDIDSASSAVSCIITTAAEKTFRKAKDPYL